MDSNKRRRPGAPTGGPAKRHQPAPDAEDELIADAEAADAEAAEADLPVDNDDEDVRQEVDADFELDLGEAGRNWERPPLPVMRPSQNPISECCVHFTSLQLHGVSNCWVQTIVPGRCSLAPVCCVNSRGLSRDLPILHDLRSQ